MYLEKIKRLIQVKKDGVLYIISSSLYYVFPQLHILKIVTNKLIHTITNRSIHFCALISYRCCICRSCTNLDAHHGRTVTRKKKLDIHSLLKTCPSLQNKVHEHLKAIVNVHRGTHFIIAPRAISSSTDYKAQFYRIA